MRSIVFSALLLWAWSTAAQESAKSPVAQASLQSSQADAFFRHGEYQKALDAYKSARALSVTAGDFLGEANTWRGETEILFELGEDQKARDACQTARQLYRVAREKLLNTGEKLALGHTWYGEADILFRLGETTKALYGYDKARELYLAVGSKLDQANAWQGEGDVRIRLGEDDRAIKAYRVARRLYHTVGDSAGEGNTWLGEAQAWFSKVIKADRIDLVSKASKDAMVAIESYQATGAVPDKVTARALEVAAVTWNIQPVNPFFPLFVWPWENRVSARWATEVIQLHSQWRKTWITDFLRTRGEETFIRAYDFLIRLRARQWRQAAEALRLAEEARSRALLDLLAAPPERGEKAPAAGLVAERQRLEKEIWQIGERLRGPLTLGQQAEFRVERIKLDRELEWNRYQIIATQEESFPQQSTLDAAAIQKLAPETGPVLLYYVSRSEAWGFLILPEPAEIRLQFIKISRHNLEQTIRAFVYDLANPLYERRAAVEAVQLWDLLIAPFKDLLPKSGPLVIVPHGPLHGLPFEALRDPAGHYLFERWSVSITPSASALAFARNGHAAPAPGDSFLGFSSGRGLNLPAGEVAQISGFFGTAEAAYQPTVANYQNYVERVTQARHLLISTRGVHVEGSRSETYLEVEPTPEVHDSRLTASEIATIPLHAELVTLAACDTSHGRALLSDERLDLTRAFLIAHATAVLATRWKVPEGEATSRFLADFYQAYRQGGPDGKGLRKDEALTEARRRSRERGDPAQVWAAWVLVGDAR